MATSVPHLGLATAVACPVLNMSALRVDYSCHEAPARLPGPLHLRAVINLGPKKPGAGLGLSAEQAMGPLCSRQGWVPGR